MLTRDEKGSYRLTRRSRVVLIAVLFLTMAMLTALWWNAQRQQRLAQHAEQLAEARADQVAQANSVLQRQAAAILKANDRLRKAGEKPVKVPVVTSVGPAGPAGRRGPGPTQSQVVQAVFSYCAATGSCQGQVPTQSQVQAAVRTYCSSGRCRGPTGGVGPMGAPGAQGQTGTPGTDGQNGQAGQNATDAQVASAVATYCGDHDCRGPKGDTGDTGAPGRDAFPFTFTFVIPSRFPGAPDRDYSCTVSDPTSTATCTEITPAP